MNNKSSKLVQISEFNQIDTISFNYTIGDITLCLAFMKDGATKIFDRETFKVFRSWIFHEN